MEVGESVVFDGSASKGEIDSWQWDFGDGSEPQTGRSVEHVFTAPGDYSVALTVRGPGGSHTAAAVVHVGQGCLPQAVLEVLTSQPKPGEPVQLSAGNSVACENRPLVRFRWDFGDGVIDEGPSRSFVSHTWARGTYPLVLEIEDSRGAIGRATRTLNVGVVSAKPVVQCPASLSGEAGQAITFNATASDPGGVGIERVEWQFSDGTSATGASVTHTFDAAGSYTASARAFTEDDRESDPCTVGVTVTAPLDFTGTWVLNPGASSLTGCSRFGVGFPASHLSVTHGATSMTAAPSGNGWPSGTVLSGMEEPPPSPGGTFRLRVVAPQVDRTSSGCGPVAPEHSVELTFTNATSATGTWRVIHDFACVGGGGCNVSCNCVASGTFSAKKQ